MIEYNLIEHRHRFAAWCAATASRASSKCRFSVKLGVDLLEAVKLHAWLEQLPTSEVFDREHKKMREKLIDHAKSMNIKGFSHGVAAKMINCYLKAAYIQSDKELAYIHPPIDRILINALIKADAGGVDSKIWREVNKSGGWSSMESDIYDRIIIKIKELHPEHFWKIEEYWTVHYNN